MAREALRRNYVLRGELGAGKAVKCFVERLEGGQGTIIAQHLEAL